MARITGFVAVFIASFTSWVATPGQAPTAFDDQTSFRFNDWLDVTSFPTDGLLVLGGAIAGLAVMEAGRRGRVAAASVERAVVALGVMLLAVGVLEAQYIMSVDTGEGAAALDPGDGLYFLILGAILVIAARWAPEQTGAVPETPREGLA